MPALILFAQWIIQHLRVCNSGAALATRGGDARIIVKGILRVLEGVLTWSLRQAKIEKVWKPRELTRHSSKSLGIVGAGQKGSNESYWYLDWSQTRTFELQVTSLAHCSIEVCFESYQ